MGRALCVLLLCALAPSVIAYIPAIGRAGQSVVADAHMRRRNQALVCAEKLVDAAGNPIKGAMSAYMHFCGERRSSLTSELKTQLGADFKSVF